MSAQPRPFSWQQLDHAMANLILAGIADEFHRLLQQDKNQIWYHNIGNGNSHASSSTRLEMHRLRAEESIARHYAVYCEVWECQQQALSPALLRDICRNSVKTITSSRVNAVRSEFEMEHRRTRSHDPWLGSAMDEFKRSMDRLYSKWEKLAEFDAKALEYALAASPNNLSAVIAAREAIHARIQSRILQARIASLNALIASSERALSATQLREPDKYRIKNLEQHLDKLKDEKRQCEQRRDEWDRALNSAVRHGDAHRIPSALQSADTVQRRKRQHPKAPCFAAAVELLTKKPDLALLEFCRQMDAKAEQYPSALKYKPPSGWKVRSFYEQYKKRSNTISRFLSDVRKHIRASAENAPSNDKQ